MKKVLICVMAVIFCFTLCACAENAPTTNNNQNLDKQPTVSTTGDEKEPTNGECTHTYIMGVCLWCGERDPVYTELPTFPKECEHTFTDGVCTKCEEPYYSTDLLYTLNAEETGYIVTGRDDPKRVRVSIPESYNGLPVVMIGERAFYDCRNLVDVVIPDSVVSIGKEAFANCFSLNQLVLPNCVSEIGEAAFAFCALDAITIGCTSIGSNAFWGCEYLKSITFTGTQEQWSAVSLGENWNKDVPATGVVCTDGVATL